MKSESSSTCWISTLVVLAAKQFLLSGDRQTIAIFERSRYAGSFAGGIGRVVLLPSPLLGYSFRCSISIAHVGIIAYKMSVRNQRVTQGE
jgi:hypothetical protein